MSKKNLACGTTQLWCLKHWFKEWLITCWQQAITWTLLVISFVNSLRPCDAIWQHRSGSTLAQVMACCLTAPSHYLNRCWLISKVYSGIHLRTISLEIPQPPFIKVSMKITYLKLNWNPPGANELTYDKRILMMSLSFRTNGRNVWPQLTHWSLVAHMMTNLNLNQSAVNLVQDHSYCRNDNFSILERFHILHIFYIAHFKRTFVLLKFL